MTVEEFLKDLNLEEYLPVFLENKVDFAVLETLTDAELKEIGIDIIGHRRKMLIALERTMPIKMSDLIRNLGETEIYRGEFEGESVLVTSHRVLLGEKTLLSSNISEAGVYIHLNRDQSAADERKRIRTQAIVRTVAGLILSAISFLVFPVAAAVYQLAFLILLAIVPALILLILGVRGFKRAIQLKDRFDEHYFLRLNTPAGQLDVFGSQDKKSLDTIAHAIRSSISSAVN